jgi:hypothetical protein
MCQVLWEGANVNMTINSGTVERCAFTALLCLALQLLIISVEKTNKWLRHYRLMLWFCE